MPADDSGNPRAVRPAASGGALRHSLWDVTNRVCEGGNVPSGKVALSRSRHRASACGVAAEELGGAMLTGPELTMPIDHAALAALVTKHNRRATFDGLVEDLERICERDRPAPEAVAAEHSRPWFAREILLAIAAARHHHQSGHPDLAMAEAVQIGVFAAIAMAHHPGPWLAKWVAYREKQAARSRAGIVMKRDKAARRQDQLRAAVADERQQRPSHSVRRIAIRLLARHGRPGDRTGRSTRSPSESPACSPKKSDTRHGFVRRRAACCLPSGGSMQKQPATSKRRKPSRLWARAEYDPRSATVAARYLPMGVGFAI